jgi:hypothetical protein
MRSESVAATGSMAMLGYSAERSDIRSRRTVTRPATGGN